MVRKILLKSCVVRCLFLYGWKTSEFCVFAKVLITEMYGKCKVITFEANDCDNEV